MTPPSPRGCHPAGPASADKTAPNTSQRPRIVSSTELFGDAQEVQIEHLSQVYRLRRTSLGKLILTK